MFTSFSVTLKVLVFTHFASAISFLSAESNPISGNSRFSILSDFLRISIQNWKNSRTSCAKFFWRGGGLVGETRKNVLGDGKQFSEGARWGFVVRCKWFKLSVFCVIMPSPKSTTYCNAACITLWCDNRLVTVSLPTMKRRDPLYLNHSPLWWWRYLWTPCCLCVDSTRAVELCWWC